MRSKMCSAQKICKSWKHIAIWGKIITLWGQYYHFWGEGFLGGDYQHLGARLFATHYEGSGGGDYDGGASGGVGRGYNNDGKGTDQSSSSRVSRDILRNVSSAMFDE